MSSNAEQKARVLPRVLRCLTVAAGSAAVSLGPQAAGLAGAAGPNCPDIEVVFARGTFEPPGVGATGQAFVDALDARLPGNSVEIYGVDYPASLDFAAAENGIADAANKIEAITANCPNTNVVLGGYSQGAAVAGYTTEDAIPVHRQDSRVVRTRRPRLRTGRPRSRRSQCLPDQWDDR
jgi:cutinase